MISKKHITGIILAGGKSRRMGVEKGLAQLKGRPLIAYAIDLMQQLAGTILISANSKAYDAFPFELIADLMPDSGPMGGIYSCLQKSETDINLVVSCDTPFIKPDLYRYLLDQVRGHACVAPWHGENLYEPLCAVYHRSLLADFSRFIKAGNFKIPDLFEEVDFMPVKIDRHVPFYTDHLFFNINRRQDLKTAEKL